MGNSSSGNNILSSMILWKKKSKHKGSKKRRSSRPSSMPAPCSAPMYDTVADFPVYSVVEKSRKPQKADDNIHYAEIEVVGQPPFKPRVKPVKPVIAPKPEITEYATIDFPKEINPIKGTLV